MTQLQQIQAHLAGMQFVLNDANEAVTFSIRDVIKLRDLIDANPERAEPTPKPPIGLRPRWLVAQDRAGEIVDAMHRYACEGTSRPIPADWIAELAELSAYLRNRAPENLGPAPIG